jgi:hypothetical protein
VLKKALIVLAVVAIVMTGISFSIFSDQLAVAVPQSKIHFTKTVSSSVDPAEGTSQFVLVLAPNKGSLYTGTMTYTANQPVKAVILHDLVKEESKGQPTWSVDGNTIYSVTTMEPEKSSGSFQFTGAAVGFQSASSFTITTSVDGWIRGQPTEVIMRTLEIKEQSFVLPESHVKVTIPMHVGFFGKESIHYIVTDSSNQTMAEKISDKQGSSIRFTPKLRWAPASSYDTLYVFTNGVKGDGIYGFQGEVFTSTPSQREYSSLQSVSLVSWKTGQKAQVLYSAEEVQKEQRAGRIEIKDGNTILNAPQIAWPGGQLLLKNATQINNDTQFDGGQVTEINKDSKTVTFIAHRGWGQDGRTIHYIVTDATPAGPAQLIGVPVASKLAKALEAQVFSEMYQFKNGIKGTGPLGFQQNIIGVKDDASYVPLCRVSVVEWKDSKSSFILQTVADINNKKSEGSVFVTLARPLSSDYVLNCPLVKIQN